MHVVPLSLPDSRLVSFFFLMLRPPPRSPLFPYTTLFRSPTQFFPRLFSCGESHRQRHLESMMAKNLLRSAPAERGARPRSEEHTSELQSQSNLVCRLLLEKKNNA